MRRPSRSEINTPRPPHGRAMDGVSSSSVPPSLQSSSLECRLGRGYQEQCLSISGENMLRPLWVEINIPRPSRDRAMDGVSS